MKWRLLWQEHQFKSNSVTEMRCDFLQVELSLKMIWILDLWGSLCYAARRSKMLPACNKGV